MKINSHYDQTFTTALPQKSDTSLSWFSPKVCTSQNCVESLMIIFIQSTFIRHKEKKGTLEQSIDSRFHLFMGALNTGFDFIGNS